MGCFSKARTGPTASVAGGVLQHEHDWVSEILTDPSYCGQIVVMTSAHVGNYGVNVEDESQDPGRRVRGAVSAELQQLAIEPDLPPTSAARAFLLSTASTPQTDDSPAHTRREARIISTVDGDRNRLVRRSREVPSMIGLDLTGSSRRAGHIWPGPRNVEQLRPLVVAYDFGIKSSMVAGPSTKGSQWRWSSPRRRQTVLARCPAGILQTDRRSSRWRMRSGMPRFPRPLPSSASASDIRSWDSRSRPHLQAQVRPSRNHPVASALGRVEITAQNHGFAVDGAPSIRMGRDHACQSQRRFARRVTRQERTGNECPVPSEASGPHDARHLFEFARMVLEDGLREVVMRDTCWVLSAVMAGVRRFEDLVAWQMAGSWCGDLSDYWRRCVRDYDQAAGQAGSRLGHGQYSGGLQRFRRGEFHRFCPWPSRPAPGSARSLRRARCRLSVTAGVRAAQAQGWPAQSVLCAPPRKTMIMPYLRAHPARSTQHSAPSTQHRNLAV